MKRQIAALFILLVCNCQVLSAGSGPEIKYITDPDKKNYEACIRALDKICADKLNGSNSWSKWMKANNIDKPKLLKIWGSIEKGENEPVAVGLRLCVALDGALSETSMQSVRQSIETNPAGFLRAFQDFINALTKAGKANEEEFYAGGVIYGLMYDYLDEPARKLEALKKRKTLIQKVGDKDLLDIKDKVLKYLDEGIKETQSDIKAANSH